MIKVCDPAQPSRRGGAPGLPHRRQQAEGDADGNPLTVSPEGIDALLSLWPIFEAFNLHYVSPGMLLDAEKTALRPCRLALR